MRHTPCFWRQQPDEPETSMSHAPHRRAMVVPWWCRHTDCDMQALQTGRDGTGELCCPSPSKPGAGSNTHMYEGSKQPASMQAMSLQDVTRSAGHFGNNMWTPSNHPQHSTTHQPSFPSPCPLNGHPSTIPNSAPLTTSPLANLPPDSLCPQASGTRTRSGSSVASTAPTTPSPARTCAASCASPAASCAVPWTRGAWCRRSLPRCGGMCRWRAS